MDAELPSDSVFESRGYRGCTRLSDRGSTCGLEKDTPFSAMKRGGKLAFRGAPVRIGQGGDRFRARHRQGSGSQELRRKDGFPGGFCCRTYAPTWKPRLSPADPGGLGGRTDHREDGLRGNRRQGSLPDGRLLFFNGLRATSISGLKRGPMTFGSISLPSRKDRRGQHQGDSRPADGHRRRLYAAPAPSRGRSASGERRGRRSQPSGSVKNVTRPAGQAGDLLSLGPPLQLPATSDDPPGRREGRRDSSSPAPPWISSSPQDWQRITGAERREGPSPRSCMRPTERHAFRNELQGPVSVAKIFRGERRCEPVRHSTVEFSIDRSR